MAPPRKRPAATSTQDAAKKDASGDKPVGTNATGIITPETASNTPGAPTNPPVKPETPQEQGWLEKAGELLAKGEIGVLNQAKDAVSGGIDAAVNAAGGGWLAQGVGAIAKGANDVLFPTNVIDLIPGGKILSGGTKAVKLGEKVLAKVGKDGAKSTTEAATKATAKEGAREAAEKQIKDAGSKDGARAHRKPKRKPARRCELVPYDELECDAENDRHHVVPDWMLRMGKRGSPTTIPDMPSLGSGLAICLENGTGKTHTTAHKHTDRVAERIGKGGKATGIPGTIQLGQAKVIAARAIEKATGGGKGKGGCDRADIQDQLDKQFRAPNDALLRGVKDARKVTDEIRGALNGGHNTGGI